MAVGCSELSTAAVETLLKPIESAAARWLFQQFAEQPRSAITGGDQRLSINGTLQLVHYLRWSWQKSRADQKVLTLLHGCTVEPGLRDTYSFAALSWLLRKLGQPMVERAVLLHTSEKLLHDRMWESVKRDKRTAAVCHSPALAKTPATILPITSQRPWRYFSAFRCSGRSRSSCYGWWQNSPQFLAEQARLRGQHELSREWLQRAADDAGHPCARESATQICMTYKPSVYGRHLKGFRLHGGRTYVNGSEGPLIEFDWEGEHLVHNLAVLQEASDEWVVMGGLQGFVTNRTCRRRHQRAKCLMLADRQELSANQTARRSKGNRRARATKVLPGVAGIRLMRGVGWRHNRSKWSEPRIVMRGDDPPGCVDRRPPFTGFPSLKACEFDGRLSLVRQDNGVFRLYARANIAYGVLSGGRFVQTASSPTLEGGWSNWETIRLHGIPPNPNVDLYFFAVQTNPIDATTLLALMPVSEPPWACIAIAFSRDGVAFSKPRNLRDSRVAFKRHESYAEQDRLAGRFSVRAEDHPVANIVPDPSESERGAYLLYIHHHVKGVTYRPAQPYVAAYSVPGTLLRRLTSEALASLDAR